MKMIYLAAALWVFSAAHDSYAQYPNRPIRFTVPFPPGGTADAVARVLSLHLTQAMGQQRLTSNRGWACSVPRG